MTLCNETVYEVKPYGDFSAPSQFYVFVGVMAFLYCITALIIYICFDDKYRQIDKIPMAVSKKNNNSLIMN